MSDSIGRRIALGTVQFGLSYGVNNRYGQVAEDEVRQILKKARDNGVDTVDTAPAYGESERVLGAVVDRDTMPFRFVSKYPPHATIWPREAAAMSLAALRLDSLYGYLFHDVQDYFSDDGKKWDEFVELKQRNVAEHIGFSLYYPRDAESLLERGLAFDIVQVPLSVLDRRFEPLLPEFRRRGIEVHARSIFLQGIVFRAPGTLPDFFDPMAPSLRNLARHSEKSGLSIQSLCLGFALSHESVDRVVIGVECVQDLVNDLRSARQAATSGIAWKALDDIECTSEEMVLPFRWKK